MQSIAGALRAHEPRTQSLLHELDGLRGVVDNAVLDHMSDILRTSERKLQRLANRLETQASQGPSGPLSGEAGP
jgi:hypothetical protein